MLEGLKSELKTAPAECWAAVCLAAGGFGAVTAAGFWHLPQFYQGC